VTATRDHLTADQAFEVMKHQSQNSNVKLRTIAEAILYDGPLDDGQSRSPSLRL